MNTNKSAAEAIRDCGKAANEFSEHCDLLKEKAIELARDIARERYTDDPDDPHWWNEDEDGDEDEDEDDDRSDYERHWLDSGYYQDARFL